MVTMFILNGSHHIGIFADELIRLIQLCNLLRRLFFDLFAA